MLYNMDYSELIGMIASGKILKSTTYVVGEKKAGYINSGSIYGFYRDKIFLELEKSNKFYQVRMNNKLLLSTIKYNKALKLINNKIDEQFRTSS